MFDQSIGRSGFGFPDSQWKDDAKSSVRDPVSIGGWRSRSRMYDFRPCARFGCDGKLLSL